jgi:HD superfamily phosphohydrolase
MLQRRQKRLFEFEDQIASVSSFSDPLLSALIETRAFRRLRDIRFLGAIDYLLVPAPNGARGNMRHTRYEHSLRVAALSNIYGVLAELSATDRRLITVAALLHDIGHAPLSHSLEPAFITFFGIDHHKAARDIIVGHAPLGEVIYKLLKHNKVDIERLIALIEGKEGSSLSTFFSGPINFDTIEGITRSQQYYNPDTLFTPPEDIVKAAILRRDETDRRMVDNFWHLKNEIYEHLINSPSGFLADLACQKLMEKHISIIAPYDYFSTEAAIFLKIPPLKQLLTSPAFWDGLALYIELPATHKTRSFYVDERGDFYARDDTSRYKQRKRVDRLELPHGVRQPPVRSDRVPTMTAIARAISFSNTRLGQLRDRLRGIVPPGELVLTCGSYARREASESSDLDFFIISSDPDFDPNHEEASWVERAQEIIGSIVLIEPAEEGAFAKVERLASFLQNIGGEQDTNAKITRRMLFLLEGEWLSSSEKFKEVRRSILERYIRDSISHHQLALFLLNDIIRYYRTIAVDYEFKTSEGAKPKAWGIRNIKLIFSRKLLYASGLFSVAATADRTRERKIEILEELFSLPVIERMEFICGTAAFAGARKSYEYFLSMLEEPSVRDRLRALTPEHRQADPIFRDLKNESHHFTRELLKLFEWTFDSTHPIRRAVIF